MAEAIKIAVRVRPFNEKELAGNQQICIEMTDKKVTVNDVTGAKAVREFSFDHAFWSHDGFTIAADGYNTPNPGHQYTDQNKVWDLLGASVLDKAWKGLNNTIFAYGQTGAGKSYSVFGYPGNPGIIPMASTKIFERIGAETESNVRYEVSVQMVEIYMEKVQDLLVLPAKRGPPLQIKSAKTGIYVQGAKKTPCGSYQDIQKVIDFGEKNRTIGQTEMNATSSRSHTVVTIEFNKVTNMGGKDGRLRSMINIVDLAGSEKQAQAGTSGDRLAEGNAINKSLSCLGNVIEVLADHAMGKGKNRVVPYRDSSLTRMLQDALGGNSATIMVAAIRPGHTYYEETLNTLKYADRAKKIKNAPTINEDPQAKLIRELKEENDKLKAMLANGGIDMNAVGGGGSDPEAAKKLAEAEEQMEKNRLEMEEMAKGFEEKLAEQAHKEEEEETLKAEIAAAKISGKPQLLNLNEDGMLDRKIFVDLSKHTQAGVGRKQADSANNPTITLGGIGIQSQHATFQTNGDRTTLVPASAEAANHIFINGQPFSGTSPKELTPNDRIMFGSTVLLYRVQSRDSEVSLKDTPEEPITYEFAMNERAAIENVEQQAKQEAQKAEQEAANAQMMNELRQKMEAEKAAQEAAAAAARQAMEDEMAKLKAEVQAKQDDAQAQQDAADREAKLRIEMEQKLEHERLETIKRDKEREERIKREEAQIAIRQAEFHEFGQQLDKVLPLVQEANLLSTEFSRNIQFKSQITGDIPDFADGNVKANKAVFKIRVDNHEDGWFYIWEPDKFVNRVEMMREAFNEFADTQELPDFSDKTRDPFWDPAEPLLIGKSYLQLTNLSYTAEIESELNIVSVATNAPGSIAGKLKVSYWPCDSTGDGEPDEELEVMEPEELLGKDIYFRVHVDGCTNLLSDLCKDVKVEYVFKHEPDIVYKVPGVTAANPNPVFNFKKVHRINPITDFLLEYFKTGNIVFKVYGTPFFGQHSAQATPPPAAKKTIAAAPAQVQAQAPKQSAAPASAPVAAAQAAPAKAAAAVSAAPQAAASAAASSVGETIVEKGKTVVAANTGTIAVVDGKKGSSCCTIF